MVVRRYKFTLLLATCCALLVASMVQAQTKASSSLQEGWYKIIAGGQHTGFMALRIELEKSTNRFISTSYIQTNALGGNLKESLVAISDSKLSPISYQYTSQVGSETRMIDAAFSSQPGPTPKDKKKKPVPVQTLTAKVKRGDQTETLQTKLEPGTFLSQFLVYVMLQSPKGLKQGNNFVYNSVLEENGEVRTGEAYVSGIEKYRGLDTFKIMVTQKDPSADRSKDQKFINYVTPQGLILMTKAPAAALSVEMVATQEEATKGFDVNQKTLAMLFKTLPKSPIQEAPAPTSSSAITTGGTPSATKGEPASNTVPATGVTSSTASVPEAANPANQQDPAKPARKQPDSTVPGGVAPPPGKGL